MFTLGFSGSFFASSFLLGESLDLSFFLPLFFFLGSPIFLFFFLESESRLRFFFFFSSELSLDVELEESLDEESVELEELVEDEEDDLARFLPPDSWMSFISLASSLCSISLFLSRLV